MYILLILLHLLFVFIAHLFGFYIIEGVFLVLMLFFLLYFSPIFFFKKVTSPDGGQDFSHLFSFELSPQKSLIIPLVLTYIGIYILAFTFSGNIAQSIHMHLLIFLAIFCLFLGYIFAFDWKNVVFFDVLGFHLLFSYITIIITSIYYFFAREFLNIIDIIFVLTTLAFSYFFFFFETKYRQEFFLGFLVSIFLSFAIILLFLFPSLSFFVLTGVLGLCAICLFEFSEKIPVFRLFFQSSRIFFLSTVLCCVALGLVGMLWDFSGIYFLLIFALFLFSVHIRFFNIISYSVAIFIVYFLYGITFSSLLSVDSVFSSLLFLYFFPILMIGNTYFWEERQKYDFSIIHYSSIAFSACLFLYSLLFFHWENTFLLFSSFGFLLLAMLFFLSYFRFYTKK